MSPSPKGSNTTVAPLAQPFLTQRIARFASATSKFTASRFHLSIRMAPVCALRHVSNAFQVQGSREEQGCATPCGKPPKAQYVGETSGLLRRITGVLEKRGQLLARPVFGMAPEHGSWVVAWGFSLGSLSPSRSVVQAAASLQSAARPVPAWRSIATQREVPHQHGCRLARKETSTSRLSRTTC